MSFSSKYFAIHSLLCIHASGLSHGAVHDGHFYLLSYDGKKADSYIKIGPEVYRNEDAFDMPRKEWSDEDLSLIMDGCLQIMKGVGYTAEKPFKNLGVRGFNLLFTMLHFTSVGRKTSRLGLGRLQDKISFEHAMDKSRVTYYNLVER